MLYNFTEVYYIQYFFFVHCSSALFDSIHKFFFLDDKFYLSTGIGMIKNKNKALINI